MEIPLRPTLTLLTPRVAAAIIDEAMDVLARVGVYVEHPEAVALLQEAGASVGKGGGRIRLTRQLVERSVSTAPSDILLYDVRGESSHTVGGDSVHFDPGSAALRVFDHGLNEEREAHTSDLVRYARLEQKLEHIHLQSTGIISSDVPVEISDCYRLYLGLRFCSKPVVTGIFMVDGIKPMLEMLVAVRGSAAGLKRKPLAIFDACPSPPLKWSHLTTESVVQCARAGIPSEFVAMPLTGATAPVTLTGALVQQTAENLAGVAIAQAASPGAPVIFGGSPSAFDLRVGLPPMGAIETMMIDGAAAQIGKQLGLPTHAYMGLSDAKCVDAQAGMESGIGAILAALAGINVISGAGMMDYETCQSLEKLVLDNQVCGMAYRLLEGISQREVPMALTLLEELAGSGEFLSHPHTVAWGRKEHRFPRVLDRGNREQWRTAGKPTVTDRAHAEVESLLAQPDEPVLSEALQRALQDIMSSHGRRYGLEELPEAGPAPFSATDRTLQ